MIKNNKIIVIFIVVLIVTVTLFSSLYLILTDGPNGPGFAQNGILYVGGSGLGNYTSIQDAIDNVSYENKTVFIFPGTYKEQLSINKTMNLTGAGPKKTIIKNFDDYHNVGIHVSKTRDVIISNMTIRWGWNGRGIILSSTTNVTVYNCILKSNGIGIRCTNYWDSSYGADQSKIHNNTFITNEIGIELMDASNSDIRDNKIQFNGVGIRIDSGYGNLIYNNAIVENWRYGVDFYTRYTTNAVARVFNNSFVANDVHASDENSIEWSYRGVGNYWSNYGGEDIDGDGFGDRPFVVDNNSMDSYPLVKPPTSTYRPFLSFLIALVILISTATVLIRYRKWIYKKIRIR